MAGVFLGDNHMRFAVEGEYGPTTWANVFGFTVPGGITTPSYSDVTTLGAAIYGVYRDYLLQAGYMHSGVHTTQWHLKLIDGGSNTFRVSASVSDAGTGSGSAEPGQVAYLIDWITTDPRRGGKARTYLPGVISSALGDVANLTPTAITDLTTRANNFHNHANALTITGQPLHFVEMSCFDGKAPRAACVGYEILAGKSSNAVATQRRRVDRLRIT